MSQLRLRFFLVIFLASASVLCSAPLEKLRVTTWNVDNLFDTTGDPTIPDSVNYTPTSWRRWTEARYQGKLTNLAVVISTMNPDILCLQELGGSNVIRDLTHVLRTLPKGAVDFPHIAYKKSQDARGIGVGLISRHPIKAYELKFPVSGMRGALIVEIDVDKTDVVCIVNHWKSWVGEEKRNNEIRMKEAIGVRNEALKIIKKNPNVSLFIAGDFNDNLDGLSLLRGLKAFPSRERALQESLEPIFYNLLGELPKDQLGSYYYARRKVWNTFDAIVVTTPMLLPVETPGPAWRLPPSGKAKVETFRHPDMVGANGRPKPAQRTRLKDGTDQYVEGYSDHFPVYADFVRSSAVKKK